MERMHCVFISPRQALMERWAAAFPEAELGHDVTNINSASLPENTVLWLDLAAVPDREHDAVISAATRSGFPVIALVSKPSETQAFNALKAGAAGYSHVMSAPELLREIALVVSHGGVWLVPDLMQRLLKLSVRTVEASGAPSALVDSLTDRELTVANLVAQGASNREISQQLGITERTVKAHLTVVFEKLQLRDRVQLALAMHNIPSSPLH
ncbi:MAG: response regulator transcription factor [Pseudomonadales bacterium]